MKKVGESAFLYIAVMGPLRSPADASFEDAILYEYATGGRSKRDADYGVQYSV